GTGKRRRPVRAAHDRGRRRPSGRRPSGHARHRGGARADRDEQWDWEHTQEEADRNPWSHVRAALTASSLTIPLRDGELALGRLQAIFFCEFDGPRRRSLYVTVV